MPGPWQCALSNVHLSIYCTVCTAQQKNCETFWKASRHVVVIELHTKNRLSLCLRAKNRGKYCRNSATVMGRCQKHRSAQDRQADSRNALGTKTSQQGFLDNIDPSTIHMILYTSYHPHMGVHHKSYRKI
jgi:hypothetical protein